MGGRGVGDRGRGITRGFKRQAFIHSDF
jgi:hypothetical protein